MSRPLTLPKFALVLLIAVPAALAGCVADEAPPADDGSAARIAELQDRIDELETQIAEMGSMEGEMPEAPAPLPAAAMGVEIDPAVGYAVEELGEGLYWVTDGVYQTIFLTTGEGVVVVDAPPNLAAAIPRAIENVTDEPVTHVIYSHAHADHIAAAGAIYPADATYIAHRGTAAILGRAMSDESRPVPFGTFVGGGPVPMPTVTFADNYTLEVGTQTLQLDYHGAAHQPGNLFIWAPEHKVLTVIDVFFPGWVPFLQLALAKDVRAFVNAHDAALSYDFDVLVSGHLGRYATRDDIQTQKDYVMDVQANAATALQTVDFGAIVAQTGTENTWHMFGTYLEAVADECARLTEPDWVGVLGAADIFTHSQCDTMVESLRVD